MSDLPFDDTHWMNLALEAAAQAAAVGDVPVGCVVVSATGDCLAVAGNRREADGDPTAHAEILALRNASRKVGLWRLDGTTVYVTLEPCPMCAGALVNARVARVVYATPDPKAGAMHSLFEIGSDRRLNHRCVVEAGLMAPQAAQQLRDFFAQLRRRRQNSAEAGADQAEPPAEEDSMPEVASSTTNALTP